MHDPSRLSPQDFIAEIDRRLSDPTATFALPISVLLDQLTKHQLTAFLTNLEAHSKTYGDYADAVGKYMKPESSFAEYAGSIFSWHVSRATTHRKHKDILACLRAMTATRATIAFSDRDKALTRGMAALLIHNAITPADWRSFYIHLCTKDSILSIDPAHAKRRHVLRADEALNELLQNMLDPYDAEMARAANLIAKHANASTTLQKLVSDTLTKGARFMTDEEIETARALSFDKTAASLILGYSRDSGRPVYFNTSESLLSIGAPGTGKSQGLVMPNLLTYPGSAIVLDVKADELWNATAAYRQANFGPVYRFAPTDQSGRSHRFNPFDFISDTALQAPIDCEVFGYQIIANNPKLHDPYWENKGRDFLWAFAMLLALAKTKSRRVMENLAELASLDLSLADNKDPDSMSPDTAAVIGLLRNHAKTFDIPDLASAANALQSGIRAKEGRLESVMDTMRRYLSVFGRSSTLRTAMSASDWHPRQLREQPGTTIYLCIPDNELDAYAPILRLLFFMHMRILKDQPMAHGDPPITFFMDEMPQLGNFAAIPNMQDTGRSAGLRLWMFAQSIHQITGAFGDKRGESLINNAAVQTYLRPDSKTAQTLSNAMGNTQNIFTGESEPLATHNDLAGRRYRDTLIAMIPGDQPLLLEPRMAYQTMADRMTPPPLVPVAQRPPVT